MQMLYIGDRILGAFNDQRPNVVSGIIAHAANAGMADFVVVLWAGVHDGRKTFEIHTVNTFEVDVLERGCAAPAVPEAFTKEVDAITQRCRVDTGHKLSEAIRQTASELKSHFTNRGVPAAIARARALMVGKCPDDESRRHIMDLLLVPAIRGPARLKSWNEDINLRSSMYLAAEQLLDEAFADATA